MKLKYGDYILIILVLLVAVFILIPKNGEGDTVVLEVDGETVKSFDLYTDTEFVYEGEYYNKIIVSNGEVCISDSNCPDRTCVHSGAIKNGNKIICCLPNKLILRLSAKKDDTDVISG